MIRWAASAIIMKRRNPINIYKLLANNFLFIQKMLKFDNGTK